jgi:hypothetical protein
VIDWCYKKDYLQAAIHIIQKAKCKVYSCNNIMTTQAANILQNSNPIDSVVDYCLHFAEAKELEPKLNTRELIRERLIDAMFDYSMSRLPEASQTAMRAYVDKVPSTERKEKFLISLGSSLAVLIRNISSQTPLFISGMGDKIDTFPIANLITTFANDFEQNL